MNKKKIGQKNDIALIWKKNNKICIIITLILILLFFLFNKLFFLFSHFSPNYSLSIWLILSPNIILLFVKMCISVYLKINYKKIMLKNEFFNIFLCLSFYLPIIIVDIMGKEINIINYFSLFIVNIVGYIIINLIKTKEVTFINLFILIASIFSLANISILNNAIRIEAIYRLITCIVFIMICIILNIFIVLKEKQKWYIYLIKIGTVVVINVIGYIMTHVIELIFNKQINIRFFDLLFPVIIFCILYIVYRKNKYLFKKINSLLNIYFIFMLTSYISVLLNFWITFGNVFFSSIEVACLNFSLFLILVIKHFNKINEETIEETENKKLLL